MLSFLQDNYTTILVIALILCTIGLAICIIAKCFKIAIAIAVLSVVAPILFTVFWGDGTSYVNEFASLFTPVHQQRIEDMYAYYKEKDAEDPLVDYDAVSDTITDVFSRLPLSDS